MVLKTEKQKGTEATVISHDGQVLAGPDTGSFVREDIV